MRIFDETLNDFINVHPTFLYESILNFGIFVVLMFLRKKKKFDGQLFYIYLIVYGIGRALIESLRTDSLMFIGFRISQVLSVVIVIFAVIMYYFGEKCRRKDKNGD